MGGSGRSQSRLKGPGSKTQRSENPGEPDADREIAAKGQPIRRFDETSGGHSGDDDSAANKAGPKQDARKADPPDPGAGAGQKDGVAFAGRQGASRFPQVSQLDRPRRRTLRAADER